MKSIRSPIAGTVWKILKAAGDTVDRGETVAIVESMKMEIPIDAESTGTIKAILVNEGEVVESGAALVELA